MKVRRGSSVIGFAKLKIRSLYTTPIPLQQPIRLSGRAASPWPRLPKWRPPGSYRHMNDNIPPPSNAAQLASPSYRIPALDQDFLLGDSMRGVRFLLEYAKAEEALRAHSIRSTIVVYGSARARENGPDRQSFWYAQARAFGRIASERGGALMPHGEIRDNVIATGGGPGIMEAANRGAREAGAPTIGFNITLPNEQEPNSYSTPDLTFRFHYFAMRKMHLVMRANALVVFPGGFGTFDELFELLTLRQTDKSPRIPIVLLDEAFWRKVISFDFLIEEGMISQADLSLFDFAEDAEAAWATLTRRGLGHHGGEVAPQ
jgi:uncharacterized protein (TIGR00730 family)